MLLQRALQHPNLLSYADRISILIILIINNKVYQTINCLFILKKFISSIKLHDEREEDYFQNKNSSNIIK